jgi:pilus assembly protein CpaB
LKRSNRLILLIGVFLAIVAFVGIALVLGGRSTTTAPPKVTALPTVVATRDIPLGQIVTADMLSVETRNIDTERKATAFGSPDQVIGLKARRNITTGAQLEDADFSTVPGITQLEVPAGMRAVAVQVDQLSGVGATIRTGDYVDAIVALTGGSFPVVTVSPVDDSISIVAGLNSTSVKLVIEGMQVIGTLLPPVAAPARGAAAPAASGAVEEPATTLSGVQEIVILAVNAQQAEVLRFAQLDGTIVLSLRSPADFINEAGEAIVPPPAGTTGVILKTLVDGGYGVLRPELVEAILPAQ